MTPSSRWPVRAPLGGLAPRRRLFVLGVVLVLVAVPVAVGAGVAQEYAVPARAEPGRPGPVVLVPGYGGDRTSLLALAGRLEASGRPTRVVSLSDGGTGDLTAQAATIDDTVRDLLRHGAASVDLVGYSAGGVASWIYLRDGRTAPAVRRVVTLGSPLQGAELAAAGGALVPGACPRACQQLAPGSSLLAGLAAGPRPGIPWLSVWSANDETVTPPTSAALPGITSVRLQSVCGRDRTAHGQLPGSPLVLGLLLRNLGAGPPSAPVGPGDCRALLSEAAPFVG